MPRFSPQAPQDGQAAYAPIPPQQPVNGWKTPSSAVSLGQHIQRECGMQGLRRYIAAMAEFLSFDECCALARAFGLSPDVCRTAPVQPPPPPPPEPAPGGGNNIQMMQLLMQLMGSGGGGGSNPLAPLLLSQLMGGK